MGKIKIKNSTDKVQELITTLSKPINQYQFTHEHYTSSHNER